MIARARVRAALPNGAYVIGGAIVVSGHEDRTRQMLRKLLLPGQKHLHWSKERPARRHRIVQMIAELGLVINATYQYPVSPRRVEQARQRCLLELAADLTAGGVNELVIEAPKSRSQDRYDNATLLDAAHAGIAPGLRYRHVGKIDEPILRAADTAVGAIELHVAGFNSAYLAGLAPENLHIRRVR